MADLAEKYRLPEYVTKRIRFYDGQFLKDDDFVGEQHYHTDRRQRHERLLHVSGIAEGLSVEVDIGNPKRVKVSPGTALDGSGRQILVDKDAFPQPDSGTSGSVHLAIAFDEQETDQADNNGVKGFTRITQVPRFSFHSDKPAGAILLAALTIAADGSILQIGTGVRQYSGLRLPGPANSAGGGTLRSQGDGSPGWAELGCSLSVKGAVSIADQLTVKADAGVDGTLSVGGHVEFGKNPIRFSAGWTNFADGSANRAEISNDTGSHKTLMIVGNGSAGVGRRVGIWDRLDVNGTLFVTEGATAKTLVVTESGTGARISAPQMTAGANQYNFILAAGNDTGQKVVHFLNSSARDADGGKNTYTIRNDGGPLNLGHTLNPTSILGNSIALKTNTASIDGTLTVGGGVFKTNALSSISPLYIRGTGLNNNAARLVVLGSISLPSGNGRGLTLLVLRKDTHELVAATNYDTYGDGNASNNLAAAMNGITKDRIGILTSYDAWEGAVNDTLRTAFKRVGLYKAAMVTGGARRPYAAIFEASSATGVGTAKAVEVLLTADANAPYAEIRGWIVDGSFVAAGTAPNALTDILGSAPVVTVNEAGQVDVGKNPLRLSSSWSASPDTVTDRAEISNDTTTGKCLMIVGNRSAGDGLRRVGIWDRLDVNGKLVVSGEINASEAASAKRLVLGNPGLASRIDAGTTTAGTDQYNFVLAASNDTGQKVVHFLNSSTREADGGKNAYTIRNEGGPFNLGHTGYTTSLVGNTIAVKGPLDIDGHAQLGYEKDIPDFGAPLKTGVYSNGGNKATTGNIPDQSQGWTHLFNARHANLSNNHQLQVAASYESNDRLFFRKVAAGLVSHNPSWNEVATRSANVFTGDQTIDGGNRLFLRKAMIQLGTTDGSNATAGEVVGGIGFFGFGQSHGQFSYRASRGFELVDRSGDGPSLGYTEGKYGGADLRLRNLNATGGVITLGEWTIQASGEHLYFKRGSYTVARISTTRDRFQVYRRLNGTAPYFYYNEDGNYANHNG